jgi:5-methylcytosine-specific restriction endonuclease McrA
MSNWIRKNRRYAIYERDNCTCAYCGITVIPGKSSLLGKEQLATLDHIVPRNAGGNNKSDNLITSCVSCNSSRKDTPLFEYLKGDMSKIKQVLTAVGALA